MKPVQISGFSVSGSTYEANGKSYRVQDLIALACKLKPFDLPLQGIYIGGNPWGEIDIKMICYHVKRIEAANLDYPVILDDEGYICDGWHRVCKAIIAGQKTIRAVRLDVMPDGAATE